MQHYKEHILSKLFTLILAVTLLVPSATKFAHVFTHEHHKHDYCKGEKKTHLHELDNDCEFYKFQLNKTVTISNSYSELFYPKPSAVKIVSQYNFINSYQKLHFSLRGPPSLI